MPKGGQRIGAGRKAAADVRVPPLDPADVADSPLLEPPASVTGRRADLWRQLAPMAVRQQALTADKSAGFAELCELLVMKDAIAAAIDKIGAEHDDAARLLVQYVKLAQRVDATLARFRLTGDGKVDPAAVPKKKAANPWG